MGMSSCPASLPPPPGPWGAGALPPFRGDRAVIRLIRGGEGHRGEVINTGGGGGGRMLGVVTDPVCLAVWV